MNAPIPKKQGIVLSAFNRLATSRFARDAITLSAALAFGQAIAFLSLPLLTRLYTPDAFGHLAYFVAATSILGPLASFGYDWALPMAHNEDEASRILALCFVIVTTTTTISLLLLFLSWPWLDAVLPSGLPRSHTVLLAVAIGVMGLYDVLARWHLRQRSFARLASYRFLQIIGTVIWQLVLGATIGEEGLIWAFILGFAGAFFVAALQCRTAIRNVPKHANLSSMQRAMKSYRAFALWTAPSNIVNTLGLMLPGLVLPSLYGPAFAGQYSLAQRTVGAPVVLVGEALNRVFWGNGPSLVRDDPKRLWSIFLWLNVALIGVMFPALSFVIFGPEVYAVLFGEQWREAGAVAGIIVFGSGFALAAMSTCNLMIYGLNHWQSGWIIFRLFLVVSAIALASGFQWSERTCALGLTVALASSDVSALLLNGLVIRRFLVRNEQS